jgi:hypothetical protein
MIEKSLIEVGDLSRPRESFQSAIRERFRASSLVRRRNSLRQMRSEAAVEWK